MASKVRGQLGHRTVVGEEDVALNFGFPTDDLLSHGGRSDEEVMKSHRADYARCDVAMSYPIA